MDERRLRRFFHFTENDLAANRRGRFSAGQEKRLAERARSERKSARDSAIILFVIGAAGLAFGVLLGSVAPTQFSRVLFLTGLGVIWPSVWAGRGVKIILAARKLQEPRLRTVSGRARLARHGDEDHTLQIGELEFDLDGDPSGAVTAGDHYTVYYVEATAEILSVELSSGGE